MQQHRYGAAVTVDIPGPDPSDVELRFGPLVLTPEVSLTALMWVRAEFNETFAALALRRVSDGEMVAAVPLSLDDMWTRARLAAVTVPSTGACLCVCVCTLGQHFHELLPPRRVLCGAAGGLGRGDVLC